jgi:hypothetical protein
MSDLEDFSSYYEQDPNSVDHVLLNIPQLKVHKALMTANAVTATAMLHGWTSASPENAMEKCFALIKAYINEQGKVGMKRRSYQIVEENATFAEANLF